MRRRSSTWSFRPDSSGDSDQLRLGGSHNQALVVLGEGSVALHPRFAETQELLLSWLSNAEGFVLPGATHFLQVEQPEAMAQALVDFYARHAIRRHR